MAEDQTSQNLTVAVRVRPLSSQEQKRKVAKVAQSSGNRVIVTHGPGGRGPDRTYNYDRVFSPYAAQEHVFESLVSPVVDERPEDSTARFLRMARRARGRPTPWKGRLTTLD